MKKIILPPTILLLFFTYSFAQSLQSTTSKETISFEQTILGDTNHSKPLAVVSDTYETADEIPSVGQQIKKARELKNISLEAFANAIGFDIATMSKVERGVVTPTREILVKIQLFLDVDIVMDAKCIF